MRKSTWSSAISAFPLFCQWFRSCAGMTRIRFKGSVSVPFALAPWRTLLCNPFQESCELRVARAVVQWRQAGRPSKQEKFAPKFFFSQVKSAKAKTLICMRRNIAHALNYAVKIPGHTASAAAISPSIFFNHLRWMPLFILRYNFPPYTYHVAGSPLASLDRAIAHAQ